MRDLEGQRFKNRFGGGQTRAWAALLEEHECTRILEVGSHEGWSASWWVRNALPDDGLITCIDLWPAERYCGFKPGPERKKQFDANIAILQEHHPDVTVEVLHSESIPALVGLREERRGYYDLAYIDGSHEALDCLADGVLAAPLLRVGGLLIFDDYRYRHRPVGPLHPKPAVDCFAEAMAGQFECVESAYHFVLRKTGEPHVFSH